MGLALGGSWLPLGAPTNLHSSSTLLPLGRPAVAPRDSRCPSRKLCKLKLPVQGKQAAVSLPALPTEQREAKVLGKEGQPRGEEARRPVHYWVLRLHPLQDSGDSEQSPGHRRS